MSVESPKPRILYVDDEEAMVFLVKRLFTRMGYEVSAFEHPIDAVQAFLGAPDAFDVVVTDYNMPTISGLEVLSCVKNLRADVPVIVISGFISEELMSRSNELGASALIYKPDTVEELITAVSAVLGRTDSLASSLKRAGEA